ncbi:MAG: cisplatin damage response ATP-dependent DNA ligase [Pseudomonadota bacterium]
MQAFANLLERLVYTPQRNGKIALIAAYLRESEDRDRGYGLAALCAELKLPNVSYSVLRDMIHARTDETLFRLSYDYVGDFAETVSLLWPGTLRNIPPPTLSDVVETLNGMTKAEGAKQVEAWLDVLGVNGRYGLIKLLTGGMRVGVSARLAKVAFAKAFEVSIEDVEEVWHALEPPYAPLFDWATGKAERPDLNALPVFRPFMLANPLEEREIDFSQFVAEWKWDGIRVQVVRVGGEVRLFSRTGDDIGAAFPDILAAFNRDGIVDGELLVRGEGGDPAPFNHLQQRLNRKTVSAAMRKKYPAFVRLYDILFDQDEDLREQGLIQRKARLRAFVGHLPPERFDVSDFIDVADVAALEALRNEARETGMEGLMLKRKDSVYEAGRKQGLWYKWKRDPLLADTVLMYAQRGHGKRSSFYSDFTFGCWDDGQLKPVGKAYFGFTDEELKQLDKWVRANTIGRFGPVREVEKALCLEVAFDSIHESPRHKSGVAMRFPRIHRIRWDKPAAEADQLDALKGLIG